MQMANSIMLTFMQLEENLQARPSEVDMHESPKGTKQGTFTAHITSAQSLLTGVPAVQSLSFQ